MSKYIEKKSLDESGLLAQDPMVRGHTGFKGPAAGWIEAGELAGMALPVPVLVGERQMGTGAAPVSISIRHRTSWLPPHQ